MYPVKKTLKELPNYIGKRLLEKRSKLGLTLVKMGTKLNVSPQQLQKYECAQSMITASRLYEIGCLFGVSVDYFFEGFKKSVQHTNKIMDTVIQSDQLRKFSILLIEDDDGDAYLTRKVAESSSVDVNILVMSNDREIFRFLRDQTTQVRFSRPDLILLDLNLPKTDGFSILQTLKQDRLLCDIPVVILSNSISRQDMISCYQNHAAGFMCKPFDFEVFQQKFNLLARYWAQSLALFKQTAVKTTKPKEASLNLILPTVL